VNGLDTSVSTFTSRLLMQNGKTIEYSGPADITHETTDAIVNAANSSLLGGGGVDGAIHRAGGPAILEECKQIVIKIGSLPVGAAVITTGGRLPTKHVIHTVGPVYHGGAKNEAEKLESCHRESIRLADEHGLHSMSFPAISTGVFMYPVTQAAAVAISATVDALASARNLAKVRFVLFDSRALSAYAQAAEDFLRLNPASPFRIEKGHA
jgi:O-acetyl-ADP-ribose deacetylase